MGSVREGIAESAEREQPCLQQERQIREGNKKIKGKKKKKKDPSKANTKGRSSLGRRCGWRKGRDRVSQRDLGLRTGG